MTEGQLPPQSPDIEQAVLGAVMLQAKSLREVEDLLTPAMFYVDAHRVIYSVIRELSGAGSPVDTLTVCDRLRKDGALETVGGAFYISQLTNKVGSGANVAHHARILVEDHIARELIRIGADLQRNGYDAPDAFDLLDSASVQITNLYTHTQTAHLGTAADMATDLIDSAPSKHYTFGIEELDAKAVFECGLPYVFAGRPGIGKSIFALEVMWHLTLTGPVLLFSPEMTERQITARILARETGVPYRAILRKSMDEQQMANVASAAMMLHDRMKLLKVDPSGAITPDQVRARTERAMKTHGVIAFAVDHLHKMKTGNSKTDRNDFERISQCMNGLTDVAKQTMLPALVMCQLNREVEKRPDKRPNMADLRGSGEIEQDAALVGLLFRQGYYLPDPPYVDKLEISIAKNRDGAVGQANAEIIPSLSRIGPSMKPVAKADPEKFTEQKTEEHEPAPF